RLRGSDDRGHLDEQRTEIAELPGGARRVVSPFERGLELDRAQQELARGVVGLAAQCAAAGRLECLRRRLRELERRPPVELREELRRVVEVVRADLEQLLIRAFPEPLRELRVKLGARRLR